jgi:flagellar L-ring protein precursor FlgH
MKSKLLLIACFSFALSPVLVSAESLYRESTFQSMTADHRAYRVGDALTVLVVENSSAASSADTTTNKSAGLGVSVQGVNGATPNRTYALNLNENFAGSGKIQRSGKLLAQLTVTVKAIAPNGDLIVAGNQILEVNDEKQNIVLEGRVRPVDVSESNTVVSTRLADAKISYVGDGILGEKQHPGILTRILSWLGIL